MKNFLLLYILFIATLTAPPLHAAEATKSSGQATVPQEILILNSYHPGYAWSDDEQAGIIDVFRAKDENRLPVIEYLDLKHLPDGRHLAELKQLFRIKYQSRKFPVVIAMDDPALEFAIDNQEKLFGNAPIVFCGINHYTPAMLKGRSEVTGIVEAIGLSFITDKSGRTFDTSETTKLFARYTPVPIYSTYQQRLGFGIVGGKLLRARIHGADAARIALRVLAGEKASSIPVVSESDSQFMFDYTIMGRFGIPLSALPEGSTVINHPLSFYATHRAIIQTALGLISFLLTVILIQRRRADTTLLRSEENFRNSLDESPLGVRIVTEEGETLYANRAILDIYGYDSIEELKTTPVERRYPPESQAELEVRRGKRKQGRNAPSEYEVSIIRKSGEVRQLQVFRKAILWDDEKQFQVIYKDITERKRAEEGLRESEEKYRNILENIEDGYFEVDLAGNIKFFNASFCRILGYPREEMSGMNNRTFMDAKNAKKIFRTFNEVYVTGIPAKGFERETIRKDGTKTCMEVSVSLIARPGERPTGFRGIARDVTERKRAEEKLWTSQKRLRALSGRLQEVREEERTRIAREIHDELGGALTGLKIDFSLLKKDALKIENETVRASLFADIDPMIKFTDATIYTVRRIAMELRPGVLDDLGLVAALEWLLGDFQKRTGIRCEWISSVEYIELDADLSTALFRIVQEALTNVARHSGATEVRVRLHADADSSTLEVEDNGRGMEKEKAMSSKSLGLLGMRERALIFGGRILVTGAPRTGTTVTVEIPPAEKRKMVRDLEGDVI
ncbi:MAG: PAS domain S-box protein [Deltaproteobacteria bacterium]|nr:PAS domain S-box protein [Deltaproteobacteria bacterium]